MNTLPDWETLSAFVDNELPAEDAAVIARAVAEDPQLARQVAAIAQLKSASAAAAPAADDAMLQDVLAGAQAEARIRRKAGLSQRGRLDTPLARSLAVGLGLAACLALGFLANSVFVDAVSPRQGAPVAETPAPDAGGQDAAGGSATPASADAAGDHAGLLDGLFDRHEAWRATAAEEAPASTDALLVSLQSAGLPLYVPDLSAAELRVAAVKIASPDGAAETASSVQVGYRGQRGCAISLFALSDVPFASVLTPHRRGSGQAYTWRVGDIGYAVVARGMDDRRLAVIARSAEAVTRAHGPLPETETRLADSRERSAPCTA